MGLMEWGIVLTILFVVINAAFFFLMPNANPQVFSCLLELNPALATYSGGKTITGECGFDIQQPSEIVGSTSTATLPDKIITAISSIFFGIVGKLGYIYNLLGVIAYLLFNIFFLGWVSIYNILFTGIPEVAGPFFVIGSLITLIQIFTIAFLIKDFILSLGGNR